jgi:hypothetical protein
MVGCELKDMLSRLHTGGRDNILYDYLLFVQASGLELPKLNIRNLITTEQKRALNLSRKFGKAINVTLFCL